MNISVLTPREIIGIMKQNRALYLSYLVNDKYISRYDEKSIVLLRHFYKGQKRSWSQSTFDGTHVFTVEYDFATNVVSVHSKINTNFYVCHGIFDLTSVGDVTRIHFISSLYICEYEKRLDEMMSKFKLAEPPRLEDYEFPL